MKVILRLSHFWILEYSLA